MKKRMLSIAIITLFAVLSMASLVLAQEAQAVFKITGLEGKVLVMIKPSIEWVEAKVGQELKIGDGIKTLSDGKAHLKGAEKVGFLVSPNSELFVELPLIAEPYGEADTGSEVPVYAPNNTPEPQASRI